LLGALSGGVVSVMYRRYGLVGAGTSPSFDRLNMLYQRIFPSCLGGGEEGGGFLFFVWVEVL